MAGQPPTINEEAGLGPNWVPLDGPPIIPGQMVAAPPASDFVPVNPKYIQGTIAPNFQHDSSFVDTGDRTAHVPKFDLMPLGPQQNSISSAQISSAIRSVVEVAVPPPTAADDDTIKLNAQTGTQYTVQLSDLNKLISMSNNAGGTVYLPPVAGTTNVALTNEVDGPFNSGNTVVTGTPPTLATSTYVFTATNPIAIGDFMFLAMRNVSSHLDAPSVSMSDSINGGWSKITQNIDDPAVGADTASLFYVRNTQAIPAGGTVTLTFVAAYPFAAFNPAANALWTMSGLKSAGGTAINSGLSSGSTFSSGGLTVSAPTTFIAVADSNNGDLLNQTPANSQQKAWTEVGTSNDGSLRFYYLLNIGGGPVNDVWTPTVSGKGFIDILTAMNQAVLNDILKLTTDFFCYLENTGTGSFNLVSTAPIDGSTTNSVVVGKNQGLLLLWDAATQAWYTERGMSGGTGLTIQQDGTNKPVEPNLNFLNPLTATDTPGTQSTNIEIKELVNAQTGATYTVVAGDKGHLITFSNTGSVAVTLPQAGSTGFPSGWFTDVVNLNTGVVTITPTTSTINGLTSLVVYMNQGARIISDGTNYFVIQGVALAALAEPVNAQTGTSYTVADSDRGKLVTFSNVAATAVTLPQAATSSKFASGWFADFENLNTGAVTITPTTSTINGAATYVLQKGQGVRIVSDGTNYQVLQGSPTKDIANGYAGLDANIHLSVAEQQTAVDARTTTTEAVADSDRGKLVTFSNSSAVAASIAQAGASSLFIAGWYCYIQNVNSGIVTLTPTTSTINGDTTLVLQKNQGGVLVSDGTNYIFVGALLGDQNTTLIDGYLMIYDGTNHKWAAVAPGSASGINATLLRGINIAASAATPSNQDVLQYNSTNNDWEPVLLDGLVHGDPVWDVDPVVIKLYDEFFGGTATSSNGGLFGNLGWGETGSTATTPIYFEGAPPHLGIMAMPPPTAAQQTSGIIKTNPGAATSRQASMPLLDYPGWKMEWVWRWGYIQNDLGSGLSSAAISAATKMSNYIGIGGSGITGNTVSRPWNFVGLRFDTDGGSQQTNASGTMTTPGLQISDTTMKFECIANPDNGGNGDRTNAQGIVVLQKAAASSASVASGASLTTSFNTAIGQNNMIVVLVAVGGNTAPTVTDTPGTSYTQNATQAGPASAFSTYIISGTTSATPVTSSTNTISVKNNNAGAQSMAIWAYEIMSTQGGVLSFDTSAGANGTGTAASAGPMTNAGQDEICFEITGVGTASQPVTNAVASGWLLDSSATALTTGLFAAAASYRQTTLDTSITGTSTLGGSEPWALLEGSFKTTISSFFDTGILPVVGQWYRLELKCVVAGQVIVTLFTNNTSFTHTFTVPKITIGTSVAGSGSAQATGTLGAFSPSFVPSGAGNFAGRIPYANGSIITLAGLVGAGPSTLNGNHVIATGIWNGNITGVSFYSAVASFVNTSTKGTVSGYAGMCPMAFLGAPAISAGLQTDFNFEIDMFKFVWDTSLATSPLTMNKNYSRYVSTPSDTGL